MKRESNYDLYEITVSPFTSGVARVKGDEINNPSRVPGSLTEERNYANIQVSGEKNERNLEVRFQNVEGKNIYQWRVSEKHLMR